MKARSAAQVILAVALLTACAAPDVDRSAANFVIANSP